MVQHPEGTVLRWPEDVGHGRALGCHSIERLSDRSDPVRLTDRLGARGEERIQFESVHGGRLRRRVGSPYPS